MESIWMGIAPGPTTTRVIAMAGPSDTIFKAQLATLFEAATGRNASETASADSVGSTTSSDSSSKRWRDDLRRAARLDSTDVLEGATFGS